MNTYRGADRSLWDDTVQFGIYTDALKNMLALSSESFTSVIIIFYRVDGDSRVL